MLKSTAIQNVNIVNEGEIYTASVWIFNGMIQEISEEPITEEVDEEIDGKGLFLFRFFRHQYKQFLKFLIVYLRSFWSIPLY